MSFDRTVKIFFEGAIKGGGFGVALGVFKTIENSLEKLVSLSAGAAAESVKMGATYERTANALTAVVGSASKARTELTAISELSRRQTGLGLEEAEKGYQRLRALNFEAEQSRKILSGLGKQKILSGADNQAVDRVIYNLTQLSSGTTRASQDIKEIIHAMPTLRTAFAQAFGTLDAKKIGKLFADDPSKAIDKLGDAMGKVGNIQGDLLDSQQKFNDQLTRSGREFAEPVLEPLTNTFKELTELLEKNRDTFQAWGRDVAATTNTFNLFLAELNNVSLEQASKRSNKGFFGEVVGGLVDLTGSPALKARFEQGYYIADAQKSIRDKKNQPFGAGLGAVGGLLNKIYETPEQIAIREQKAEFGALQESERTRAANLKSLELYHKNRLSVVQNAFDIEAAIISGSLTYNLEQEKTVLERQSNLRRAMIQNQISVETAYFNERAKNNADNSEELEKIAVERAGTLGKLNTEYRVNEIKSAREIAEIEQRIFDGRRQAAIGFKNLQITELRQGNDKQIYEIERYLSKGLLETTGGYAALLGVTTEYTDELINLTRAGYEQQLQDLSLTKEQRTNLVKQMYLEIEDLTEQNRRKVLDIEEKKYQEGINRIENFKDTAISSYKSLADFYGQIGAGLFNPQNFGIDNGRIIKNTLLRGNELADFTRQMTEAEAAQLKIREQMDTLRPSATGNRSSKDGGGLVFSTDAQTSSYDKLITASEKLDEKTNVLRLSQEKLKDSIPGAFSQFEKLAEQISGGNVRAFDLANAKLLEYQQLLQNAALESEIASTRDLIEFSKDNPAQQIEYQIKLSKLLREQEAQRLNQAVEKTNQYKNSLEGLTAQLEKLRSGDSASFTGLQYLADQTILREQIGLYGEIVELQTRIATVGEDSAERYQRAWLSATLSVKEANIRAVEDQIAAQVKLADQTVLHGEQVRGQVLRFLSEQRTINDAFADGIIKTYDKLTDYLNKKLGALGDIPILGDLAKFGNEQFSSKITQGLLNSLFPPEIANAFKNETGNPIASPIVKKLDDTNKILAAIAAKAGVNPVSLALKGGVSSLVGAAAAGGGGFGSLFGGGASGGFGGTNAQNIGRLPNGELAYNVGGGGGQSSGRFLSSIFGKGGIFGEKGFGNNVGTYGGIGAGANLIGGLVGGRGGGFISNIGSGLAIGAQIGSIIPGVGTAIGAVIGGGIGLLQSILAGDPKRKKDKKENLPALNKGLTDAFEQFRQLVVDTRSLRVDGDSALSKGQELRGQIASGFGIQFLSKKYRKQSDTLIKQKLEEIDRKPGGLMAQLQEAAEISRAAGERRQRILPEFADGYAVSEFARRNGLLSGGVANKDSLPSLLMPGEMVVNQTQQRKIRALSGYDVFAYADIPNYSNPKKMAAGGFVSGSGSGGATSFTVELTNVTINEKSSMTITSRETKEREFVSLYKSAKDNKEI